MLKLVPEYINCYLKELLRDRSAAFFSLIFPAVLLLLFGKNTGDGSANQITYIIYCNYAVQSVMLQYLGITVSTARNSAWEQYLKILPVSDFPMIAGRVLSCLLFSLLSLMLVVAVYFFSYNANLSLLQQVSIIFTALAGGIPMALLGIAVGRIFKPAAARSLLILMNLLLLFGSFALSKWLVYVNLFRHTSTVIYGYLFHDGLKFSVIWLLGYTVLFYFLPLWLHACVLVGSLFKLMLYLFNGSRQRRG